MSDNNFTSTDAELDTLLDFIAGRGYFSFLPNGIHTFPCGDDNNKKIYAGCCELERRGKIKRIEETNTYVLFGAIEAA